MKKSPFLNGIALGLLSTLPALAGDVALKNPGFEDPYEAVGGSNAKATLTGSAAQGWEDNSNWAELEVAYAPDSTSPHEGGSAQKITVSRLTSGAAQIKQLVQFTAGHQYVFHVWMKAEQGTAVRLLLRKQDEPWTTYAEAKGTLTDEWQELTVSGSVPEETTGFLMIVIDQPGTVWIDDAKLEDLTN